MLNIRIFMFWLVAAAWLVISVKADQPEDISLDLDDLGQPSYETTEVKLETSSSLLGWYKMTNGFILLVHSKSKETFDVILKYLEGKKVEMPGYIFELIKTQYAVFACIIIGLLFTVTMLISGLIFFCCRMCGKCEGKRVQIETSRTSVWRKVFIVLLIVFLAFLLPAVITLFIINSSLNSSLPETEKIVNTSLVDVDLFLNHTQNQLSYLVTNGMKKAVDGITRKLNGVKAFVESRMSGIDMEANMKGAKLVLFGWKKIAEGLHFALNVHKDITLEMSYIGENLTDIQNSLKRAKLKCNEENCKNIEPEIFKLKKNITVNIDDLNEAMSNLNNLNEEDYAKILIDIKQNVENIPSLVEDKTHTIRQDIIRDLKKFSNEVLTGKQLKMLRNNIDLARESVQKTHHQTQKSFPDAYEFDKYRWYTGLAVGIVIAIVVGGLLLGLFFGICGHNSSREATKRTTMSNGAGLILMFIVYWMFLFSGLLMLITTGLFAAGVTVHTYLCQPLMDKDFKILDQIMNAMQHTVLNESSIAQNVIPSNALKNCSRNATLYMALNLEQMNITSMLDYTEKLKIVQRKTDLNNIKYPELKFITEDANYAFDALLKAINISIDEETFQKLQGNLIDGYETQFQIISNITSEDIRKEILLPVEGIGNATKMVEERRLVLQELLKNLSIESQKLESGVMEIKVLFIQSENLLLHMIKIGNEQFVEEVTKYGDNVIEEILVNVKEKLATCKPIWTIFDATRTILCKYYIQPLNGIWFAIGWSLFFFIPSIIVSTKLSKHFFKMSYDASEEKVKGNGYELEHTDGYKVKPDNGWYSSDYHF
uniref:Prominin-1-A n=1 Tax=Hadrurus spadix TaxID=141984 RepID=A0A1W7R9W7_9SCOR